MKPGDCLHESTTGHLFVKGICIGTVLKGTSHGLRNQIVAFATTKGRRKVIRARRGSAAHGSIKTVGTLAHDIIEVEIFGIGDVEADFDVDTLYTTVSGTVNFLYSGEAYYHEVNSTGEYELRAYDLQTENTSIKFSGSGLSYVTALQNLVVNIIGSGDVYYKGNPTIVSDISGSGEIIDDN